MEFKAIRGVALGAAMVLLAGCSTPLVSAGTLVHAAQGQDAIEQVIRRANDEQAQALAQNNPQLMQDTSTANYFNELTQTNAQLAASGVRAIKLVNIQWGPVSVNGASAQATTFETWRTALVDGSVDVGTDENVYALVNDGGGWKIQSDAHPQGGNSGSPATQPAQPAAPGSAQPTSHRSTNWSGYQATGGKFTAVTGTWVVPQVNGNMPGADSAWVGIGGVNSNDLIQAGTDETASGSGHVQYDAWVELLPRASQPVPLSVSPGDSITVTLSEQSAGQWHISMKDNTTGQTYDTTRQYSSSESSAEWIEEAPSGGRGVVPLDSFGTVGFSGAAATENGKTVNLTQANAQGITMINGSGQALTSTSAIGSDGASFSVSRTQASSAVPGGSIRLRRVRAVPLPFPIAIGF